MDYFKANTSKEQIYREIRRSIIMGNISPGTRLDISQLANQYHTSVTPVRDALQLLSQDDLITIKPRSGYFVAHMTFKKLRDLLEVRKILELAGIEMAAKRITDDELKALQAVHAGYTGDDDVSYDRYTDENRQFHYLMANASGNQELAGMIARLHDRLARFMVYRHAGESQEVTHARIIEALSLHDVNLSRQFLLEDIETSRDAILNFVFTDEADSWKI
jgi:GntR family transcriptional regulator, rspAB operon transcriptional repressor